MRYIKPMLRGCSRVIAVTPIVCLSMTAQQVEKATNGRIKLQMLPKHPSAAPGTFDAVRDDLVDVSYVTASYTPARHVLPLLAELPGSGATSSSPTVRSFRSSRLSPSSSARSSNTPRSFPAASTPLRSVSS